MGLCQEAKRRPVDLWLISGNRGARTFTATINSLARTAVACPSH